MEAEGRVLGPPLPPPSLGSGGEAGAEAKADPPAGSPGAARGALLAAAAAEVLALDDEEDDLEVFSKVRRRPPFPGSGRAAPRRARDGLLAAPSLAGTSPCRAPGAWGRDGT